jgi:hypothetical protein
MICSCVNLNRFIVRLLLLDGLYSFLEEFAGLTSRRIKTFNPKTRRRSSQHDGMVYPLSRQSFSSHLV